MLTRCRGRGVKCQHQFFLHSKGQRDRKCTEWVWIGRSAGHNARELDKMLTRWPKAVRLARFKTDLVIWPQCFSNKRACSSQKMGLYGQGEGIYSCRCVILSPVCLVTWDIRSIWLGGEVGERGRSREETVNLIRGEWVTVTQYDARRHNCKISKAVQTHLMSNLEYLLHFLLFIGHYNAQLPLYHTSGYTRFDLHTCTAACVCVCIHLCVCIKLHVSQILTYWL